MMPSIHRLRDKKDFRDIFKGGQLVKGQFLALKIKEKQQGVARIGFMVGSRVAKKAAARNKLKRRLRAVFYLYIKQIKRPVDIVALPSADIITKNFQEIKKEAENALLRAHLL